MLDIVQSCRALDGSDHRDSASSNRVTIACTFRKENNTKRYINTAFDHNEVQFELQPENLCNCENEGKTDNSTNDLLAKHLISLAIQLSRTVDQMQRMEKMNVERNGENPWKIVANIADTFFLLFYSSIIVVINVVMFGIVPLY